MHRTPLALTMGCPCGIGPEITLLAARTVARSGIRCIVVGDLGALQRAAALHAIGPDELRRIDIGEALPEPPTVAVLQSYPPLAAEALRWGRPNQEAGRAQLAWIDRAVDLVVDGHASAIVTAPVSKEVIAHSGAPFASEFAGHTEHIARRVGAHHPVMLFVSERMTVALVTTHLPLSKVPEAITADGVANATARCGEIVFKLGKRPARIAVAALNPHAGEGGMFGREEASVIEPGIAMAREQLARARIEVVIEGPVGAETAFRKADQGHYDAVVAMYHDQGTIPMKLVAFGKAVNVTAGLPIVRTSVDHGTAYDIAGKGIADPGSMVEAIELAFRLAQRG